MSDLVMLYSEKGFTAKPKTAGELCGPCPWCGGKDRFTLFVKQGLAELGRYWCRKCDKHGDAIQFLRDLDGMGFREAQAALGLQVMPLRNPSRSRQAPAPTPAPEFTPLEVVPPCQQWQLQALKLIGWAQAELRKSQAVQEWLQRERGLTLNSALGSGLGWIAKDYYRPREAFGLPPELNDKGKPKKVWLPKGLCIPVGTRDGDILRVKIRLAPSDDEKRPKYIPVPQAEKCTAPLVLESPGASSWQVVESELDAILLWQEAGHLVNVVALGSASYRPDAATWAKLRTARRVLISLDYDDAGNKAACQWWEKYLPAGHFKLWPVPEGKDPCDAWRAGWKLSDWVRGGL